MVKKYFKTKEEFIKFFFNQNKWKAAPEIERRNDLAPRLGLTFKNKMDITGEPKDDGDWAGSEYYDWDKRKLPKSFPVMMVLSVMRVKYDYIYDVVWVYSKDFK